jgi:Enterobacterial TraT complement resistance protein
MTQQQEVFMTSASGKLLTFFMALAVVVMSGCAAVTRVVDYGHMKTDVAMGETVFLSPSDKDVKRIYVDVRNTSKNQAITNDFRSAVISGITGNGKGYEISKKPSQADYILQANIRYEGEVKEGMRLEGMVTGAGIGALSGLGIWNNSSGTIGAGLAGGALGFVADLATRVKTDIILVDLQITERLAEGEDITGQEVDKTSVTSKSQSEGGIGTISDSPISRTTIRSVSSNRKGVKIYDTAVAAKAMQINLDQAEAERVLIHIAGAQIAGIF